MIGLVVLICVLGFLVLLTYSLCIASGSAARWEEAALSQRELEANWQECYKATVRADKRGKRCVSLYKCRDEPGYGIMATQHPHAQSYVLCPSCVRLSGMSLEDWTSKLMYAIEGAGHFRYANRDQLDTFVAAKDLRRREKDE